MKPIFKEEQDFLEENLGIKLPDNIWRDGTKIYLNSKDKTPLIKFKVEDLKLIIEQNNIIEFKGNKVNVKYKKSNKYIEEIWTNKTFDEETKVNLPRLKSLYWESIYNTTNYILLHSDYDLRISLSGGKDSDLEYEVVMDCFKILLEKRNDFETLKRERPTMGISEDEFNQVINNIDNYLIDFFNPSNETAQTYLHIKNDFPKDRMLLHNPEIGWAEWLKTEKNYFIPSVTVRNCCSTYKEGKVKKVLDKSKKYIMFLGARKYESSKRANYDWDLTEAYNKMGKDSNMPDNWRRFLPIVNWRDEDVWMWLLHKNIKFNDMYKLGYNRTGCLICPFASDYVDLLTRKYYPQQWKRWEGILEKNYELYDVANRLKWTLEEWKMGKWKQGMSKENYLIQNKATKERVEELADIKGISIELAEKYFQKKCNCGKKLNPDEVAINLKMYGRGMDISKMQCKKCFCESNNLTGKEYQDKVHEFRNEGCNLF